MVTHWSTDPLTMDNPLVRPSAQSLQKPQVFVKVEFGVSWSAQHPPRKHGIEFKSRALRERNPDFPRHVPAPTTNYLAATSTQQGQQDQRPPFHLQHAAREYGSLAHGSQGNSQQQLPPPPPPPPPQISNTAYLSPEPCQHERGRSRHVEAVPEPPPLGPFPPHQEDPGEPRADGPASADRHERGSSAPPPLSDNSWDVVQGHAPPAHGSSTACVAAAAAAAAHQPARPVSNYDVMKALPALPSGFRLGEDDMPWEGTWAFPMGFEPFLEPDPYLRASSPSRHASPEPRQQQHHDDDDDNDDDDQDGQQGRRTPLRPAPWSPASPPPPPPSDPARRRELEALGSAMMTVDNGFENQWWNSGDRGERRQLSASVAPVHPAPPPAAAAGGRQSRGQMAPGWVGAPLSPPSSSSRDDGPGGRPFSSSFGAAAAAAAAAMSPESSAGRSVGNVVVSPVSSYGAPLGSLNRTLSTRSEELWLTGGRYA